MSQIVWVTSQLKWVAVTLNIYVLWNIEKLGWTNIFKQKAARRFDGQNVQLGVIDSRLMGVKLN